MAKSKGGRPPKEEPAPVFSFRLDPKLRRVLEAAGKKEGRTLTAEIHWRLVASLRTDIDLGEGLDNTSATVLAVAARTASLAASKHVGKGRTWQNDWFAFHVTRGALIAYLDKRAPETAKHIPASARTAAMDVFGGDESKVTPESAAFIVGRLVAMLVDGVIHPNSEDQK